MGNVYAGTEAQRLASTKTPAAGEVGRTEAGTFDGDGVTTGPLLSRRARLADVAAGMFIDFTTKADGDPPGVVDTGHPVDFVLQNVSGRKPQIASGRLVAGGPLPTTSASYADYYQVNVGTDVTRLGCVWTQPAGTDDGNGTMCLAAWAGDYEAAGTVVPSSRCHLTYTPGTGALGNWKYWVGDGNGHLFVVKQGFCVNPPADGVTDYVLDCFVDVVTGTAYVQLPDNTQAVVTNADIATMCGVLAIPVFTFAQVGGTWVQCEHFANAGGNTAKYPGFKSMWAEVGGQPRSRRSVSARHMAKAVEGVKALIPAAAATPGRYSPTTQRTQALASSTANITDGTSNCTVAGVYAGPTGTVVFDVDVWVESTATDVVFGRMAGTTNTPLDALARTVAGSGVPIRHRFLLTGLTPNAQAGSGTYTLQMSCLNTATSVVLGGSGGSLRPPIVITATPL